MSIGFLYELERTLEKGGKVYGCASANQGRWELSPSLDAIRKVAKRLATAKKSPIQIMQLLPSSSNLPDGSLLIAAQIGDDDAKGPSNIKWSTVGSIDAAATMRDVSRGPSPYFALQVEEDAQP